MRALQRCGGSSTRSPPRQPRFFEGGGAGAASQLRLERSLSNASAFLEEEAQSLVQWAPSSQRVHVR